MTAADDRFEIIEVCIRFHWCYDRKDWDDLGSVLDEVVSMPTLEEMAQATPFDPDDYLDRYQRRREDLVRSLASTAAGLRTQHLVAGHRVQLATDAAVCNAHSMNVHLPEGDPLATPLWHGNTYRFDVVRTTAGWRIRGVVPAVMWSWGDDTFYDPTEKQRAWTKPLER